MKTAIVIGSTGLIGQQLCLGLAQTHEYAQVLAISRTYVNWNNPKIRSVVFDFSNWKDLEMQLKNFTGLGLADGFCALGTTIAKAKSAEAFKKIDLEAVIYFTRVMNQLNSQKLFVVSSMGANSGAFSLYTKTKGQMEEQVAQQFKGKAVFVRPSLLLGHRGEFRLAEKVFTLTAPLYSFILLGPLKKYKPIQSSKVATSLIALATTDKVLKAVYENDSLLDL